MIRYNTLENLSIKDDTVVCIGNFDGLHLGHRLIISTAKNKAKEYNYKSLILTFHPHPIKFFGGDVSLISTEKKRLELFTNESVDYLISAEFNRELSSLSPVDFFQKVLLEKLNTKVIVVGVDYRFGAKKAGDINLLKTLGEKYNVECIFLNKLEDENKQVISSSKIRELLINGNIEIANQYLNRPYSMEGIVIHGDKKGRELGYPTINLDAINEVTPKSGVYAAKVLIKNKMYNAMAYIGSRPTINNVLEKRVEANIFDFNEDVYGEYAEIFLYKYTRGDIKFNSFNELTTQMANDKIEIINFLNKL